MPSNDKGKQSESGAKESSKLTKGISIKIKAMGISRPPTEVGADLSHIYVELEEYRAAVDKLIIADNSDFAKLADLLMDVRASLEHLRYHCKVVKRPLDRVIDYCYAQLPDEEESEKAE